MLIFQFVLWKEGTEQWCSHFWKAGIATEVLWWRMTGRGAWKVT